MRIPPKAVLLGLLPILALAAAPAGAAGLGWKDVGEVVQKADELRDELHLGAENERELGREVAAHLVAKFGLYSEEDMTRYVSMVGLAVARKAGRADVPYRFGILNTRSVNAYAAPGGYVFITRGLLQKLGNEAQLAGVLAHEIVHVDRKHAIKGFVKAKAAGELGKRLADKTQFNDIVGSLIEGIVEKGFPQADEYDADNRGIGLASACGYDAGGLPSALKKLYGQKEEEASGSFLSRHPPLDSRLSKLEKSLKKLPSGGQVLKKRFLKNVAF